MPAPAPSDIDAPAAAPTPDEWVTNDLPPALAADPDAPEPPDPHADLAAALDLLAAFEPDPCARLRAVLEHALDHGADRAALATTASREGAYYASDGGAEQRAREALRARREAEEREAEPKFAPPPPPRALALWETIEGEDGRGPA